MTVEIDNRWHIHRDRIIPIDTKVKKTGSMGKKNESDAMYLFLFADSLVFDGSDGEFSWDVSLIDFVPLLYPFISWFGVHFNVKPCWLRCSDKYPGNGSRPGIWNKERTEDSFLLEWSLLPVEQEHCFSHKSIEIWNFDAMIRRNHVLDSTMMTKNSLVELLQRNHWHDVLTKWIEVSCRSKRRVRQVYIDL